MEILNCFINTIHITSPFRCFININFSFNLLASQSRLITTKMPHYIEEILENLHILRRISRWDFQFGFTLFFLFWISCSRLDFYATGTHYFALRILWWRYFDFYQLIFWWISTFLGDLFLHNLSRLYQRWLLNLFCLDFRTKFWFIHLSRITSFFPTIFFRWFLCNLGHRFFKFECFLAKSTFLGYS